MGTNFLGSMTTDECWRYEKALVAATMSSECQVFNCVGRSLVVSENPALVCGSVFGHSVGSIMDCTDPMIRHDNTISALWEGIREQLPADPTKGIYTTPEFKDLGRDCGHRSLSTTNAVIPNIPILQQTVYLLQMSCKCSNIDLVFIAFLYKRLQARKCRYPSKRGWRIRLLTESDMGSLFQKSIKYTNRISHLR